MDTKELVEYFKQGLFAEAYDKRQQEFNVWTEYYQDGKMQREEAEIKIAGFDKSKLA